MKITNFFRPAVIIAALPNTISNGETEDAVPLMADLNHIVNQVNANAAQLSLTPQLANANSFTAVQSGLAATSGSNFPIASQVQNQAFNTLTSTLGTNTITARVAALTLGAYAAGQVFTFIPSQTNTGPSSLNIDSLNSSIIYSGGATLAGGELRLGVPAVVEHDGSKFNLLQPPFYSPSQGLTRTPDSLTVDGNLTVSGTSLLSGMVSLTAGIIFTGALSSGTGIGSSGANGTLRFYANGSQYLTLDTNGTLATKASATGGSGFNLPHGAAPTSPVDGDMWSTTTTLNFRLNGVTKTVTLT